MFEAVALLEGQRRLHDALTLLPSGQRQVVALSYFDGLSLSEVALKVQVPLGTVKTRARLALQKLFVTLREP